MKNFTKYFYLSIGILAIILGTIGIFLPILPTVPFLLLALFCFGKSSKKAYNLILNNKYFGKTLKDYKQGKGLTPFVKVKAILFLSLGIGFSIYKMHAFHFRIFLCIIWFIVCIHILMIKNKKF
ncbi:MAG: YbaN family protein [Fusobacterium gastrosuis]|uniref:YbaN family protein n=1 Tax=Fusobacterium gastrosuis TaxID=1755100 RepID=UPI002A977576|nr:YbaN family protein [Fusobacterium gastrosuis]